MLEIYFIFCLLVISGCIYLIRGGTEQLWKGPWPDCHLIATAMTPLYFAPFCWKVLHIHGYRLAELTAIHEGLWYFTIAFAWQSYFSIGSSTSQRRVSVGWIDWLLSKTWGAITVNAAGTTTNSAWWRVGRDGTGMFLRMSFALPLFLALGAMFGVSWHHAALAAEYTALFAFVTVLIYGWYNWAPWFTYGNAGFNWSEFVTGIWFAGIVFFYLFRLAIVGQ